MNVREAWQKLFDVLRERKKGYHAIPQVVREDLAKFCFAFESCAMPNRDRALMNEGRREVWLRMLQHWNLSPDELAIIYRAAMAAAAGSDR